MNLHGPAERGNDYLPWYVIIHRCLWDHDAEQRNIIEELKERVAAYEGGCLHDQLVDQAQKIEQLNEKVAAYEGGCLHDQLVAHAQKIEQLEQQNTALRGGVARTCTTMGR